MIYHKKFKHYWLFWFKESNTFSIVDNHFKNYFDIFRSSLSFDDFVAKADLPSDVDEKIIYNNFKAFLKNCEIKVPKLRSKEFQLDLRKRQLKKLYKYEHFLFTVNTDSLRLSQLFLTAIAHLKQETKGQHPNYHFDIQNIDDHLCLFLNESLIKAVPKKDYHLIQGKFIFTLLNGLYKTHEKDWLGTLHGSTIFKNEQAALLIGTSGSGKSTACALLAAHGYSVMADDMSPLSKDHFIYYNPGAISIKSGALDLLQPYFPKLETLPSIKLNSSKGLLKYLPTRPPKTIKCTSKALILINYQPDSATNLEPISIAEILEPLIPDSWLSPLKANALSFMDWLKTQKFYKLTYSNPNEMIAEMDKLFDTFNTY